MPRVTAVVPNWNQRGLLERLLRCLERQTRPPEEVLVVDNGSEDDSVKLAGQLGARVVPMGLNAGFSRAVNRGISESRGDWVAVLNNDVELEPDWLERLMDTATSSGAWFATGKTFRAGSTQIIDATFDAVCRGGCAWRCGEERLDGPAWASPRTIRFAPFTAALFRAELFARVGLLDEEFESYLEDVDFGLRCAAGGYEGRYVPEAVAYHRGSATLGRWHPDTVRRIARNQVLLVAKHYPRHWLWRLGWPVLVGQLLWGLVALRHGAGWSYLRGKIEGVRLFGKLRRRGERSGRVSAILRESESQLRQLQQLSGFDWYWRLYFALT